MKILFIIKPLLLEIEMIVQARLKKEVVVEREVAEAIKALQVPLVGSTGATGATGATGNAISCFGSWYSTTPQIIANNGHVAFENLSDTTGCVMQNSSDNEFTITSTGNYLITWGANLMNTGGLVGLVVEPGGTPIAGASLDSGGGNNPVSLTIITPLTAREVISLSNLCGGSITIRANGGDSAFINFVKLN